MRTPAHRLPLLGAGLVIALALLVGACGSTEQEKGLTVTDGWARTTAPSQETGALYAVVTGAGEDDRLVNVQVPNAVAAGAQIHHTIAVEDADGHAMGGEAMDHQMDGAMSMRRVDGIAIPAEGGVALEPGGYHVMLMDLAKPLATGDAFDATFVFEKAGAINVPITVRES